MLANAITKLHVLCMHTFVSTVHPEMYMDNVQMYVNCHVASVYSPHLYVHTCTPVLYIFAIDHNVADVVDYVDTEHLGTNQRVSIGMCA